VTFDDDYIQLNLGPIKGPMRVPLKQLGLSWPPPEFIAITGGPFSTPTFKRLRYSAITDQQRQRMTHVCRGAEYVHCEEATPEELH
jgi:hypothetical protein